MSVYCRVLLFCGSLFCAGHVRRRARQRQRYFFRACHGTWGLRRAALGLAHCAQSTASKYPPTHTSYQIPPSNSNSNRNIQSYIHTCILYSCSTHIYMYIYIYIFICMLTHIRIVFMPDSCLIKSYACMGLWNALFGPVYVLIYICP